MNVASGALPPAGVIGGPIYHYVRNILSKEYMSKPSLMRTGITNMNRTDFNWLASIQAKVPKPTRTTGKCPGESGAIFFGMGGGLFNISVRAWLSSFPGQKNPAEAG